MVSAPEEASKDVDASARTVEDQPSLLIEFIHKLLEEGEYDDFSVVDDNARMHRTQSYYRIELTSSLLFPKVNKSIEWRPQDPVVGLANNTKDRWGLVKKNSSLSVENNHINEDERSAETPSNLELSIKKPTRRGSIDHDTLDIDLSEFDGSSSTIEMAIEIASGLTPNDQQSHPEQKSSKSKSQRKQAKHKATKSKRDSEKEKRRKGRKARKKKKKEQEEHFQEQADVEEPGEEQKVKKGRRSPQKWHTLLNRSESFGRTSKPLASKRKSAPSVFSPMCKSKTLPMQPSRTFSPPFSQPKRVDDSLMHDEENSQANGLRMFAPNLFDDDSDQDNIAILDNAPNKDSDEGEDAHDEIAISDSNRERRISAASYNAIYDMKKRPPVPESATSEEDDDDDGEYEEFEESIVELSSGEEYEVPLQPDDSHQSNHTDTSSSEYEVPIPASSSDDHSYHTADTATNFSNDIHPVNNNMIDASIRSVATADTFQRKPPTHTNSFELTHRRSAVRHSMKRRVVKMTPQDLQSRIMEIQLTDEQQLQQTADPPDFGLLLQDDDEEQDADGVPINPPELCENDYDYTSSAEDEEDFE